MEVAIKTVSKNRLILIGASTGGPGHLKKIFIRLESTLNTPVVIAQHMNPLFISSFVKQFDDELSLKFFLANQKHFLELSSVYVCATHCELIEQKSSLRLQVLNDVNSHFNPSIEHLFSSAIKLCQDYDVLAILLTGIGSDGAQGLSDLKNAGATCIAESEDSAIVYGMPKKAVEINGSIEVMSLDEIIKKIKQFDSEYR